MRRPLQILIWKFFFDYEYSLQNSAFVKTCIVIRLPASNGKIVNSPLAYPDTTSKTLLLHKFQLEIFAGACGLSSLRCKCSVSCWILLNRFFVGTEQVHQSHNRCKIQARSSQFWMYELNTIFTTMNCWNFASKLSKTSTVQSLLFYW